MRVLWLSPWLRPLARVQCEALRAQGIEVLLVTSNQHPESAGTRDYELVLDPRPKTPATWPQFARAWRTVRSFGADVAITELVRDPRWITLAHKLPRVQFVHDDRPHDAAEALPGWERALFGRWHAGAAGTVAFSEYVAGAVGATDVVPLTSDVADADVPVLAGPPQRRDFVVVGRLNPYKNIDVTLAAWARHVAGPAWRGDELVLVGDSDRDLTLPAHVRWRRGPYRYADVLDTLAAAKGSVAHYRRASQSGVQVLSMQLGVTPIVSDQGGLPEFQPPGEPAVGVDDVAGLAATFDALADPDAAFERGRRARAHYVRRHGADVAASALATVLSRVRSPASATARVAGRTSR